MSKLRALEPVDTASLYRPLHRELIGLLRTLNDESWDRPAAGSWRVRDVAAHLLHGDLRKLSSPHTLDAQPDEEIEPTFEEVVEIINRDNDAGVEFLSHLSPRVLTDLLDVTGRSVAQLFAEMPLHDPARTAVLWAGELKSETWMDVGREFTERWHHQMQIRDAVGAPLLLARRWIVPVLDLSVRALPRAYGNSPISAPAATSVVLDVHGDTHLVWTVRHDAAHWQVSRGADRDPQATIQMDADTAWRLFYGMMSSQEALSRVTIVGDPAMVEPILQARSVMI